MSSRTKLTKAPMVVPVTPITTTDVDEIPDNTVFTGRIDLRTGTFFKAGPGIAVISGNPCREGWLTNEWRLERGTPDSPPITVFNYQPLDAEIVIHGNARRNSEGL